MKIQKLAFLVAIFALMISACEKEEEENKAPTALFTVTPKTATVGDDITLTDQSGDDGTIASWLWDFGDGNTSTEQNPVYVYSTSGEYTITLTVTDDKGLTGTYTDVVQINDFKEIFLIEIGAKIGPSAPAIADDGTIYIGATDNRVYAYNADGTKKWHFEADKGFRSTPAVGSDGTVYAACLNGSLYALNSADGTQKWAFQTGAQIFYGSPAIGSDGTIYIGSDDMLFYSIKSDGNLNWKSDTLAKIRSSAAIGSDGTLYFGSLDGILYAYNSDGSKKWEYDAGAKIEAGPALASDGSVIFGDGGGVVHSVNTSGTSNWTFSTEDSNPVTGGCALAEDGTIYFGTKVGSDGSVFIYSLNSTGTKKWGYNIPAAPEGASYARPEILATPTVGGDGSIYLGSSDGNMNVLKADGTLKFQYKVKTDALDNLWDQAMWSSAALSDDGILYFGDYTGNFYGIQVSATGLASSNWPTEGKNLARTHR